MTMRMSGLASLASDSIAYKDYEMPPCGYCGRECSDHAKNCKRKKLYKMDENKTKHICAICKKTVGINSCGLLECRGCNSKFIPVAEKRLIGRKKCFLNPCSENKIEVYFLRNKGKGVFPLDLKASALYKEILTEEKKQDD